MTFIKTISTFSILLVSIMGCAVSDLQLQARTARLTGCPRENVVITQRSEKMHRGTSFSWEARCGQRQFSCEQRQRQNAFPTSCVEDPRARRAYSVRLATSRASLESGCPQHSFQVVGNSSNAPDTLTFRLLGCERAYVCEVTGA